jgi:hypothetical protein
MSQRPPIYTRYYDLLGWLHGEIVVNTGLSAQCQRRAQGERPESGFGRTKYAAPGRDG